MLIHEEAFGNFDTSAWSIVDNDGTILSTSECGLYTLLGGYGVLGENEITTNISMSTY